MPGFELFGELERNQVNHVLESGVLMRYGFDGMRNGHWKAKEFEAAFASKMQSKHCQLVSSGTAALTVALAAAGIGVGDEVIMPTFTFVASFESIMALGAVPVLVDIDDTLTLNPQAVKAAITPKTKCVMPVHMCGSMADLDALQAICAEHDLILLEDACQAIGGSYKGTMLGAYGDLGCFSFDFVKTITCGEGGGIITNNDSFAKRLDQFQDHGHDHIGNDRGAETHPYLGYNFRISELHAAVGLGQLQKFEHIIATQKANYTIMRNALSAIDGISFRRVPEGGTENYSFLNFYLPSQELAKRAQQELAAAGVDVCFYWFNNNWHYIHGWEHLQDAKSMSPMHQAIQDQLATLRSRDFSASDAWMGRNISSLVKLSWTQDQLEQRVTTMKNVLQKLLA